MINILKNKAFWIVSGAVLLVAILGIVLFAVFSGGDSDNTYTAETAQQILQIMWQNIQRAL